MQNYSVQPEALKKFTTAIFEAAGLKNNEAASIAELLVHEMCIRDRFAAVVTRMGRSGMIDVLREDYITATIAKGIPRHTVYMKYAFKNAMIPIVTLVGMQLCIRDRSGCVWGMFQYMKKIQ